MGDVDETTPEVRIGDRERREVDGRLQRAYADGVLTMTEYEERSAECWKARTRGELEPLVRDLPPDREDEAAAPVAAPQPAAEPVPRQKEHLPAHRSRRKVGFGAIAAVVLLGAAVWGGSRVVTADDGSVMFGNRDVVVAADDDNVDVGMLFGNLKVTVPADARVRIDGGVAFGNVRCAAACDGSGQREVVVDASGAFGNISVVRPGEQPPRDNDRNDNDNDNDNDG
jgi:Domain of unknown function (DUF1707)